MSQAVATIEPDDDRLEHAIIRAAQDDSIDIAKLQALLDMQRQVAQDRSKRMFNTAMASAQAEMLPVIRDAQNKHTKSKYARLETIDGQMRPIYTHHGFAVRYGSQPCSREGWMRITITISHSGGHWEENYLDAPPDEAGSHGTTNKTPIMAVGSSVTYLRRYLLCMAFNIVLADDLAPDTDGQNGDGQNDAGSSGKTRQDKPQNRTRDPLALLEVQDSTQWLRNLQAMAEGAATLDALVAIGGHHSVLKAKAKAPLLIRQNIEDWLRKAHERLAPAADDVATDPAGDDGGPGWDDPVAELIAEIETMDAEALSMLPSNKAWAVKARDMFPPDHDRINEAIELRKAALKGGTGT
jgi:hypothetical protein